MRVCAYFNQLNKRKHTSTDAFMYIRIDNVTFMQVALIQAQMNIRQTHEFYRVNARKLEVPCAFWSYLILVFTLQEDDAPSYVRWMLHAHTQD
jgi:hypothetical protein